MSEELQNARKEVWEFARMIAGNLTADQYKEIFQCGGDYEVFDKYTYEGAKELFEAWSQKNIEVGDVCRSDTWVDPFVVTYIVRDSAWKHTLYHCLFPDGSMALMDSTTPDGETIRKTGRVVDVRLVTQMI